MKLSECIKLAGGYRIPMRAILFWDDHDKGDYYLEVAPKRNPHEWIRNLPDEKCTHVPGTCHYIRCGGARVSAAARKAVASYLDSGEQILGFMGYADCRICGDTLGTRDMGRDGLVWPEMASHYVLKHGVWTPEHEEVWQLTKETK